MIFTPDEVVNLNEYQACNKGHPFTCGCRGDGNHRQMFGDLGSLVATTNGWVCVFCDYKQDWAHEWMKDGSWRTKLPGLGVLQFGRDKPHG